jgi:hypothetical protein
MNTVISSWIVLTVILGACAWVAVWSRRPTRLRLLSVAAFFLSSPVALVSLAVCLGWPVPLIGGVTGPSGDYLILGSKLMPNEAIYILIDLGNAPRYYVLPWNQDVAKQIQDAIDNQSQMQVTIPPYEMSWERRKPLSFHELPQPKVLPDKPRQAEAPAHFDSI